MVFGAIGIAKDDSKALGVVGIVLWIIAPLVLVGIILSGLNGNGGGGFF